MKKIDLSSYAQQIIANPAETENIILEARKALDLYIDDLDKEQKATAFRDLLAQIQQGVHELSNMVKMYSKT